MRCVGDTHKLIYEGGSREGVEWVKGRSEAEAELFLRSTSMRDHPYVSGYPVSGSNWIICFIYKLRDLPLFLYIFPLLDKMKYFPREQDGLWNIPRKKGGITFADRTITDGEKTQKSIPISLHSLRSVFSLPPCSILSTVHNGNNNGKGQLGGEKGMFH